MALGFEKFLRIHSRHAARAGSRDGLPIAMVLHIAGRENSIYVGFAAVVGQQIPVLVHIENGPKDFCIWFVSDSHENPFHC